MGRWVCDVLLITFTKHLEDDTNISLNYNGLKQKDFPARHTFEFIWKSRDIAQAWTTSSTGQPRILQEDKSQFYSKYKITNVIKFLI